MAAGWLRGFARGCRDREVAAARHDGARWIQPPRPPKPSALARVLVALQALGGEAPVPDVVDAVNRFFETNVRTNNTRREVLLHQELFEFVDEERKVIRLTDGGQEYLQAYLRAGGQTGLMAEG